jgi:glycosyltransferase involved in cell wall biosynthesis
MKFTVIIPSYNRAKYILEAIASVRNQFFNKTELIIVDDGSSDETQEILQSKIQNKEIRYLYQNNSGPSVARNNGARHAHGEYLIFLDSDDLLLKSRINELFYLLKKEKKKPDLVYSPWITVDTSRNILRTPEKKFSSIELIPSLLVRGLAHPGACAFRKDTFWSLGGFNEEIIGVEDWEICQRFALEQKKILHLSKPGLIYVKHDHNLSSNYWLMLKMALQVVDIGFSHKNTKEKAKKILWDTAKTIQYFETCRRLQLIGKKQLLQEILETTLTLFRPNSSWHKNYKQISLRRITNNLHLVTEIRNELEINFIKKYNRL